MRKKKAMRKTMAICLLGALALNLTATATPAMAAKKAKEVDLNGTYHARLGLQTADNVWIARFGYFDEGINEDYQKETDNQLVGKDPSAKGKIFEGTFTDAQIAGNGTYTVSVKDADFGGETTISQLHLATDIPVNDTIKFSDVSVKVDDKDVVIFAEGYPEDEDKYLAGGMDILLFNHWRPELITALEGLNCAESADNGWKLLQGTGGESIQITFTVSGFAYDNPDAQEVQEDATPEVETANPTHSPSDGKTGNNHGTVTTGVVVAVVFVLGVAVVVSRKGKMK